MFRLAQPHRAVSDHPIALGYLETAQEPDSHGWPPLSSARSLLHYVSVMPAPQRDLVGVD
jgi:hypothetical protein